MNNIQPDPGLARPLPHGLLQRIPHVRHLGMQLIAPEKADASTPVFYLPFQDRLVGNTYLPALHGGAVASFMENAALLHLLINQQGDFRLPKAIDFNIDYVRSAGPRDTFALCEVAKLGRRVALVNIRCWQRHYDRPSALARIHYLWEELETPSELAEDITT